MPTVGHAKSIRRTVLAAAETVSPENPTPRRGGGEYAYFE
jgi:hypothetical protein